VLTWHECVEVGLREDELSADGLVFGDMECDGECILEVSDGGDLECIWQSSGVSFVIEADEFMVVEAVDGDEEC